MSVLSWNDIVTNRLFLFRGVRNNEWPGHRWYTHYMHALQIASIGVTVRLFASLRELTGEHEAYLRLPIGSRPADVWDACVQRWPALAARRQSTVLAVNREFARGDIVIQDGDEVALLPPVSGGAGSGPCDLTA